MITNDLLINLFCRRVEEISAEKRLTDAEKERIIQVFRKALADPFMDEHQIYPQLTREDTA